MAKRPNPRIEVLRARYVEAESGCWEWIGRIDRHGYGRISGGQLAHRCMLIASGVEIPAGMVTDHLCRNRRCVNPAHLEVVTHYENDLRGESLSAQNARKTHCKRGHPFDEANTYVWHRKDGRSARSCRACGRERWRRAQTAAEPSGGGGE